MVDTKATKQTQPGLERVGVKCRREGAAFGFFGNSLRFWLGHICLRYRRMEGNIQRAFQRPLTVGLDPRAWQLVPIKRRVAADVNAIG